MSVITRRRARVTRPRMWVPRTVRNAGKWWRPWLTSRPLPRVRYGTFVIGGRYGGPMRPCPACGGEVKADPKRRHDFDQHSAESRLERHWRDSCPVAKRQRDLASGVRGWPVAA